MCIISAYTHTMGYMCVGYNYATNAGIAKTFVLTYLGYNYKNIKNSVEHKARCQEYYLEHVV
jgi:hypothetical protein